MLKPPDSDATNTLTWDPKVVPSIVSGGLFVCPGTGTHSERVITDFELVFVRRGVLGMVEAARELIVHKDTALLLWPGRRHRGLMPYQPDLSFYWVHFVFAEGNPHPVDSTGTSIDVPQVVAVKHPEQMIATFDRLLHALAGDPSGRLEASFLLSLALLDLSRDAVAVDESGGSAHCRSIVRRIDEYIAAHLHQPIATRDVASALGYNPDYLSRVYRSGSGETITDGIHRRRVAEARLLLTQTTRTVDEVAYECGYSDPGYFRRTFKRRTGSTPTAFRDMYYRAKINTR